MNNRRVGVVAENKGTALVLNVAILGFGIETRVTRGENRSKTLHEDFVVLTHQQFMPQEGNQWDVIWPKPSASKANLASDFAIALWVAEKDKLGSLQATGHWIPTDWIIAN
jgi:hypothetical protein